MTQTLARLSSTRFEQTWMEVQSLFLPIVTYIHVKFGSTAMR